MFVFVRCVAEAVCEVGVRGLVGLVPGLDAGDFYRDAPPAIAVSQSEAA